MLRGECLPMLLCGHASESLLQRLRGEPELADMLEEDVDFIELVLKKIKDPQVLVFS